MTTLAQVKKVFKPLVERHPDLAIVGPWLIVRPVRHLVRGLVLDRTSAADHFRPEWAVMHLFDVRKTIFLSWGSCQMPPHLYRPGKGLWRWSQPEDLPLLREVIEQEALPKLRSITTIEDLMAHLADRNRQLNIVGYPPLAEQPYTKLIFDVALGDLDAARKPCEERVPLLKGENYYRGDADDHATVARLKELCARYTAGDRRGLAALLHEWEATTVRNLAIEHLWEPTPFPLEMAEPR